MGKRKSKFGQGLEGSYVELCLIWRKDLEETLLKMFDYGSVAPVQSNPFYVYRKVD